MPPKAPVKRQTKLNFPVVKKTRDGKEVVEIPSTPPKAATYAPTAAEAAGGSLNLLQFLNDETWRAKLSKEFQEPYFVALEKKLSEEYAAGAEVFPPQSMIFTAFNETPWDKVKVVLIGQDPYHDVGQAHGLCFSVLPPTKPPPSLVNVYKELTTDIGPDGFQTPSHGCLIEWAREGVLMLNATLTVRAHQPNSHEKYGWGTFTDNVIRQLSSAKVGLVFLLWGGFAKGKAKIIDAAKHRIVMAAHPSPLSVKQWTGCRCFSQCNAALAELGKTPIKWALSATPPLGAADKDGAKSPKRAKTEK
jgi:uracil-DNA glycosylase